MEIYECGDKKIRVDHFKRQDSIVGYVKFVNCLCDYPNMTVTGDFGNWSFCRNFIPSPEATKISQGYWIEKASIHSSQDFNKLDMNMIQEDIYDLIDGGLVEWDLDEEDHKHTLDWFRSLLEYAYEDNDFEYRAKAFLDVYRPKCIDYDDIPLHTSIPPQLLCVFDAFELICESMKKKLSN